MNLPAVPESCTYCPHIDEFHSNCSHPSRQSIIQELDEEMEVCPLFKTVRSDAMRHLEKQVEDN